MGVDRSDIPVHTYYNTSYILIQNHIHNERFNDLMMSNVVDMVLKLRWHEKTKGTAT